MYLELVDALRCTAQHTDTPLVASISRRSDRDIVSGVLGCPVCFAEYPIENGVAIFGEWDGATAEAPLERYAEPADEMAIRCAAMLDLYDPGGIVVLGGEWGRGAAELVEMTRTLIVLLEPPANVRLGNGIAAVRTSAVLPLAPGSARGIALDTRTSSASIVASAARVLKPGGRLIAGAAALLPPGVTERARDDRHWVGEADTAATAPIPLGRTRRPGSS